MLALLTGLGLATISQGGFHAGGQIALAAVLAAAVALSWRAAARGVGVRCLLSPLPACCAAAAVWLAGRGVLAGAILPAARAVGTLAVVVVAVVVCRQAGSRATLATVPTAIISMGLVVALSGWVGVAFHLRPWAMSGMTTWRASSTITYPNAAAALLVPALLVLVARLAAAPHDRFAATAATVVAAGAAATQSRAGAAALVVGLVTMAGAAGPGRVLRGAPGPLVGAAVAAVGLLPGLYFGSAAAPLPAFVGLVGGVAVAIVLAGRPVRTQLATVALVVVATATALATRGDAARLIADRLNLTSSDRAHALRSAWSVVSARPLVGVGPGQLSLAWTEGSSVRSTNLVHNEYVQLTAEAGVVGLALVLILFALAVRALWRSRGAPDAPKRWAPAVGALAALAVHSAFDFLWHLPVLVLLAGLLFAWATTASDPAPVARGGPSQPRKEDRHAGT